MSGSHAVASTDDCGGCESHAPHGHETRGATISRLRLTLVLAAAYLVAEVVGGWLTNSLALLADAGHVVLGVRNHDRQELAGVKLDGQLFTVFTLRDGRIVHLRDHAHRAQALSDAGLDYQWR